MSFCFCFRTFHFFCSIGLVLRPETAAESDINIEEPHEIPIPNISARWPTVEDTMLRDNSPTRNNADYQTNSKTKHSRASFNIFLQSNWFENCMKCPFSFNHMFVLYNLNGS